MGYLSRLRLGKLQAAGLLVLIIILTVIGWRVWQLTYGNESGIQPGDPAAAPAIRQSEDLEEALKALEKVKLDESTERELTEQTSF